MQKIKKTIIKTMVSPIKQMHKNNNLTQNPFLSKQGSLLQIFGYNFVH
jgi:hypothetical protein